ncbi:MAG TPA: SDR family oxidoreductase [Caulobacteraceae bacterium]|nr:SDR family oxidoreductase [Caulobacteraceae bacterium]
MRVFVTGATGFIGSAIVNELLAAGHDVLGLARNEASAEALTRLGVAVHRGDLTDTDSLVAGVRACDGVIHTAFIHDWSQFMVNIETDRRAVTAMTGALEGSNKPIVIASGTLMIAAAGGLGTEAIAPPDPDAPRAASEIAVLTTPGVRGSIVRLPPTVHGAGDHGFMPRLIDMARRNGAAAYVGDGANRWPAVHRLDAARVFRLGLEKAAPGSCLHAVAEEGVPMRAIAETIGRGLGLPVKSVTPAEAPAHFDFLAMFVGVDNPTSSAVTRESLGWSPGQPELLADMRDSGYFS